jgi:hypothetical protein
MKTKLSTSLISLVGALVTVLSINVSAAVTDAQIKSYVKHHVYKINKSWSFRTQVTTYNRGLEQIEAASKAYAGGRVVMPNPFAGIKANAAYHEYVRLSKAGKKEYKSLYFPAKPAGWNLAVTACVAGNPFLVSTYISGSRSGGYCKSYGFPKQFGF